MKHGRNVTYVKQKCRCDLCTEAHRRAYTMWMVRSADEPQLVPSLGAIRRIRALQRMGYRTQDVAKAIGYTASALNNILYSKGDSKRDTVRLATHRKIAAFYEVNCMTFGGNQQARDSAVRKGFPGPLSWNDIDDPNEKPKGMNHEVQDQ